MFCSGTPAQQLKLVVCGTRTGPGQSVPCGREWTRSVRQTCTQNFSSKAAWPVRCGAKGFNRSSPRNCWLCVGPAQINEVFLFLFFFHTSFPSPVRHETLMIPCFILLLLLLLFPPAVLVRFLTRRFIGEYASNASKCFQIQKARCF